MPNPVAVIAGGTAVKAMAGGISERNQAKSAQRAANAAASIQSQAIEDALAQQETQYDTNKGYIQPFYDQGVKGNAALNYGLGFGTDNGGNTGVGQGSLIKPFSMSDYQEDPGYQFRLSEGQKALDRLSSAKRGYFSGAAQKGLMRFNQDQASNEYQNAYNRYNQNQQNIYNRLNDLASTGYSAGANLATLGQNYANNYSDLVTDRGSVLAQGVLNANAAKQAQANANLGLVLTGSNAVVGAGMGAAGMGGYSNMGQGFVGGLSGNPFGSYSAFGGNKYGNFLANNEDFRRSATGVNNFVGPLR